MNEITITEPEHITDKIVQYYCAETKQLKKSQVSKALKFIRNNCVEKISDGYIIKPIIGYNKTVYAVKRNPQSCNCQYFVTQKRKGETPTCSHILAVIYYKRMRK